MIEAVRFLKGEYVEIEKRKQWPAGFMAENARNIQADMQVEDGKALCYYGDAGWGKYIHEDKYLNNHYRDEIVDACAELLIDWLKPVMANLCVAYVPSYNRPELVKSFAHRVAHMLGIPCLNIILKVKNTRPQKELENSFYQCENAFIGFSVSENCPNCNILLVDDIVDSRWTLTVCGYKLKERGACSVYPFAIASAAGMRGTE